MGFDLNISVPAFTVFLQGVLSFFSPCVFPLIPLYIGYLSGGTVSRDADGRPVYNQKKVLLHTLFFVFGIGFAFFTLGLGVSALGAFFGGNKLLFARIGGVLVFLFGLYQLGVFGNSPFLSQEHRLPFTLERLTMSPVTALLMGFTFSFAWTPCVGPALASVLLMTASAGGQTIGFLLIGLYTFGFVLPFLLVGIFTTRLLNLFKKRKNIVTYTVKIGAVLMLIMGVMMVTGQMNGITGYLSSASGMGETPAAEKSADVEEPTATEKPTDRPDDERADDERGQESEEMPETESQEEESVGRAVPAIDFTLADQYGEIHALSDYEGKVIFLNFWATWCPPCRNEMPDIQALYESYSAEDDSEVVILGVAAPGYGQEETMEKITAFLDENGYTYPVLMDTEWSLFTGYGITAFPTTFMIDKNGNVYGYVSGQLNQEIMLDIIEQTLRAG